MGLGGSRPCVPLVLIAVRQCAKLFAAGTLEERLESSCTLWSSQKRPLFEVQGQRWWERVDGKTELSCNGWGLNKLGPEKFWFGGSSWCWILTSFIDMILKCKCMTTWMSNQRRPPQVPPLQNVAGAILLPLHNWVRENKIGLYYQLRL